MSSNSKQIELPTEVAKVDDAYLSALLLCFSRIFPAILNTAIDLNLFEIIAKAKSGSSLSASEIASQLPNQHPELANRLERILPILASYCLLDCSIRINEDGNRERVYALTPIGQYFACDANGGSLGPLSRLMHRGYSDVWNDVKDAIMDPNNKNHFTNIYGMALYQYTEEDKEMNHMVNKAMAHAGPLEMKRILELYKGFEGVTTLVDVGGGEGRALQQIISKYPSIKGINFDLPQVIHMHHLFQLVCHNWSDEDCVKFLRNCYKSLPKHGKVIVLDYIMPEIPNPSNISKHTCVIDTLMFLVNEGKERSEKEFQNLCMSSGFSKFHVACSDFSAMSGVMEFYK
ncbi:Winged helix-like DNA-binding domain superfamily [Sesbania bispinosa]|nr:Winged helix-like DNA-binding domain superfamily [Sesbania bispinosa]